MRVNFPISIANLKSLMVGLVLVLGAIVVFTISSSFWVPVDRDAKMKQVNLLIRRVGDQLLLQSGDKNSRVLPVVEKAGTFVLSFEKALRFNHDSLMALSYRLLPKTQFPSGYTVTVHDCNNDAIVFGFAFSNEEDILACSGRVEPPGCYTIEFSFPDFASDAGGFVPVREKSYSFTSPLALASYVVLLGMAGALLVKRFRGGVAKQTPVSGLPTLGKFLFDAKEQRLFLNEEITSLTDKECKVLELLHENFGELIPRETLMQKIWIDEGVITGRSLDMFISKLRKKLSQDPELKITNVHGKGYKLELIA